MTTVLNRDSIKKESSKKNRNYNTVFNETLEENFKQYSSDIIREILKIQIIKLLKVTNLTYKSN